ncbi:MAG: metallophosphoesterase [Planctomycetota bacterium]|jgi:rubrerythrin|nr:metallophosphoesterase [Planctomycetota bacterium]
MLAKIDDNVFLDRELTAFTVSGDPGCDGYNVESAAVLEAIVRNPADFHLILGDLVPVGREQWFRQFDEILRRAAAAPVFCLVGNHDRPDYDSRLGRRNYFIRAKNALVIVLDNANWEFAPDADAFLRDALAAQAGEVDHLFLAFHVPPPNPFSPNSVPPEEWAKVRERLEPHKSRIRAVLAGHVHSAFGFPLDDLPVIVTGGGGARLDPVDNGFLPLNQFHFLWAKLEAGGWKFTAEPVLPGTDAGRKAVGEGTELRRALTEAFDGECRAHLRYLLFAERARLLGEPGLAKMFLAAADSERVHAANLLLARGEIGDNRRNLAESVRDEENEWRRDYVRHLETSRREGDSQAEIAFACALKAEKVHHSLFKSALDDLRKGEAVRERRYFTCSRCGFTHAGDAPPPICPACGTDDKRFVEVQAGADSSTHH